MNPDALSKYDEMAAHDHAAAMLETISESTEAHSAAFHAAVCQRLAELLVIEVAAHRDLLARARGGA